MFRLSFYPLFGSYWIVLITVIAIGIVLVAFRPEGERLSKFGGRCLLVLRLIALLLLLFGMLRPTLVYTQAQRLASTLNILLDQSESMNRPDEIGGNTRFHVAKDSLAGAAKQLRQLQNQAEVKCFAFDATLSPLELDEGNIKELPDEPLGKETALGAALDTIRERSSGKRVLGTILLSDGTQRTRPPRDVLPQDAAARLRDAGMPLYAVPLGQAGVMTDVKDVAVESVQSNDRVFVKNNLLITGSIRVNGYLDQPIPVQLLFETTNGIESVVETAVVQAQENGQLVPYRFSFAPQSVGYFKYTVQVPQQEKELIETNNKQSNFVRVIDGGLKVLYIQGERNLEQGPLRQSLGASADIQVEYRAIRVGSLLSKRDGGTNPRFQQRLEQATAQRVSWVQDDLATGKYNVYILDDIDSKAFKGEELQALADRIKDGAGLIMLGGLHAFAAGGYADTPLAEVAPIELRRADRQPLDAPIRTDIHWSPTQPIPMRLTSEGKRHYVMRLDPNPAKNEECWQNLPPLLGANRFDKLKPGASLLAEGPDGQRLLVSQMFGLGRVLAFAGDSTYRWRLAGFGDEHKRFWRQVILWLAKMEAGMDGECWISIENNKLLPGDTAKFQVFLRSTDGKDIRNFSTTATVSNPNNKKEPISLVNEDGIPTGSFHSTDFSGDYMIHVEASQGDLRRESSARFLVQNQILELDNPVAFPQLLSNISELTGGKSVPPERLGTLLDELIKQSNELVEKRETKRSLFDSWGFLSLFVIVLGAEWFLRKYWGLV
jgi:uncharacterized membrane protein